jgi:hypothetical protein
MEFKTHDETPKKLIPSASVGNATIAPPTTSKEEEEKEHELIRSYFKESDKDSNEESEKEKEMVEDGMHCLVYGEDPCVWEQHECAIFVYADLNLCSY